MNCDELEDGWFELKGYVLQQEGSGSWEIDIGQGMCEGTVGGNKPFVSHNHAGRCGYVNVFWFGQSGCKITDF